MSNTVMTLKNCVGRGYPDLSNNQHVKQTINLAYDSFFNESVGLMHIGKATFFSFVTTA